MKRNWAVLGVLVASLLLAGLAVAATSSHSIDWRVMAGGGGSGAAGTRSLDGTIGQALVGVGGSGDTALCAGFWCRWAERAAFRVYLPIILRK